MTQAAEFWDQVADKYAATPIRDTDAYEYTLDRTRSYLNADDRVLEIGCGTGSTALLLAPDVAVMVGTDVSSEMVRIAREKVEADDAVRFKVATALQAAQLTHDYNVVMGFNILHLVEDMEDILITLYRQMETGGLLITKTPCLADPSVGIKRFVFRAMVPVMQMIGKAPFVRYLSFQELEAAITSSGFEIIETSCNPAMSRYIVARKP